MKLVNEKNAGSGNLVRTVCVDGPNMPLLPGDMVRHWQDSASSGTVVAVSADARIESYYEALVLWTRVPFNGNYPIEHQMTGSNFSALMSMLDSRTVSKKYAYDIVGFNPHKDNK